jgi:hypothetical protein
MNLYPNSSKNQTNKQFPSSAPNLPNETIKPFAPSHKNHHKHPLRLRG